MMLKVTLSVLLTTFGVASAQAACFGSGAFAHCTDNYGNSYNVQRFGTQTLMNGYNAQTGNAWSQRSQTFGNMTYQNGYSSDGGSWNMTQQQLGGGMQIFNGTNSQGQSFHYTCTKFGGCY